MYLSAVGSSGFVERSDTATKARPGTANAAAVGDLSGVEIMGRRTPRCPASTPAVNGSAGGRHDVMSTLRRLGKRITGKAGSRGKGSDGPHFRSPLPYTPTGTKVEDVFVTPMNEEKSSRLMSKRRHLATSEKIVDDGSTGKKMRLERWEGEGEDKENINDVIENVSQYVDHVYERINSVTVLSTCLPPSRMTTRRAELVDSDRATTSSRTDRDLSDSRNRGTEEKRMKKTRDNHNREVCPVHFKGELSLSIKVLPNKGLAIHVNGVRCLDNTDNGERRFTLQSELTNQDNRRAARNDIKLFDAVRSTRRQFCFDVHDALHKLDTEIIYTSDDVINDWSSSESNKRSTGGNGRRLTFTLIGQKTNQLIGMMSFGVQHLFDKSRDIRRTTTTHTNTPVVDGWYYLLSPEIGCRKHLLVFPTKFSTSFPSPYFPPPSTSHKDTSEESWMTTSQPLLRQPSPTSSSSFSSCPSMSTITVFLSRQAEGYGFTIKTQSQNGSARHAVCVGRVKPGGAAERAGLMTSDLIMAVSGRDVTQATAKEVAVLIRSGVNAADVHSDSDHPLSLTISRDVSAKVTAKNALGWIPQDSEISATSAFACQHQCQRQCRHQPELQLQRQCDVKVKVATSAGFNSIAEIPRTACVYNLRGLTRTDDGDEDEDDDTGYDTMTQSKTSRECTASSNMTSSTSTMTSQTTVSQTTSLLSASSAVADTIGLGCEKMQRGRQNDSNNNDNNKSSDNGNSNDSKSNSSGNNNNNNSNSANNNNRRNINSRSSKQRTTTIAGVKTTALLYSRWRPDISCIYDQPDDGLMTSDDTRSDDTRSHDAGSSVLNTALLEISADESSTSSIPRKQSVFVESPRSSFPSKQLGSVPRECCESDLTKRRLKRQSVQRPSRDTDERQIDGHIDDNNNSVAVDNRYQDHSNDCVCGVLRDETSSASINYSVFYDTEDNWTESREDSRADSYKNDFSIYDESSQFLSYEYSKLSDSYDEFLCSRSQYGAPITKFPNVLEERLRESKFWTMSGNVESAHNNSAETSPVSSELDYSACSLDRTLALENAEEGEEVDGEEEEEEEEEEVMEGEKMEALYRLESEYVRYMKWGLQAFTRPLLHLSRQGSRGKGERERLLSVEEHRTLFQNIEKLVTLSEFRLASLSRSSGARSQLHLESNKTELYDNSTPATGKTTTKTGTITATTTATAGDSVTPKFPVTPSSPGGREGGRGKSGGRRDRLSKERRLLSLYEAYSTYREGLPAALALVDQLLLNKEGDERAQDFAIYVNSCADVTSEPVFDIVEFLCRPPEHLNELVNILTS